MDELMERVCDLIPGLSGCLSPYEWVKNPTLRRHGLTSDEIRDELLRYAWRYRERLPAELAVYVALSGGVTE